MSAITSCLVRSSTLGQPSSAIPAAQARMQSRTAMLIVGVVFGCSFYANLSLTVTNAVDYRYFPPFRKYKNLNMNHHLGAEYCNIARALAAGEGFANPFGESTGPTAWMPPVLPVIMTALLWAAGGDENVLMAIIVLLQASVLSGTGVLVMALARQTARNVWPGLASGVFLVAMLSEFFLWYQFTHDSWLILLSLDVLLAGLCWGKPLDRRPSALRWGLFGGLCALINPIVAMVWGILTLIVGMRRRRWSGLALAVVCAGLAVTPWMVRNRFLFGRWIPVKSNLTYELYQSQCIGPNGLVEHPKTFISHPYTAPGPERAEYIEAGEMAFLDRKGDLFTQAVRANPRELGVRMANRFLAATLWYVPFDPQEEAQIPGWTLLRRLLHPWPFLALLFLLGTAGRHPLHPVQWAVIGLYVLYLSPYIAISYYDRYAVVLIGAKVLLVVWGADRLLAMWRGGANLTGPNAVKPQIRN